MPEGVIDQFEAIEIEEENGYFDSVARLKHCQIEFLLKSRAIWKIRERIVIGEMLQPLFEPLPLGDVVNSADDPARPSILAAVNLAPGMNDSLIGPICRENPVIDFVVGTGGRRSSECCSHERPVVWMNQTQILFGVCLCAAGSQPKNRKEFVGPALFATPQIPVPTPEPDQPLSSFQVLFLPSAHIYMLLERHVNGDCRQQEQHDRPRFRMRDDGA